VVGSPRARRAGRSACRRWSHAQPGRADGDHGVTRARSRQPSAKPLRTTARATAQDGDDPGCERAHRQGLADGIDSEERPNGGGGVNPLTRNAGIDWDPSCRYPLGMAGGGSGWVSRADQPRPAGTGADGPRSAHLMARDGEKNWLGDGRRRSGPRLASDRRGIGSALLAIVDRRTR
jgi:hypothetical protein